MKQSINIMCLALVMIAHTSLCQEIKQGIQFKLFGFNRCINATEKIVFCSLRGQDLHIPIDTMGICLLPDTGVYTLRFNGEIKTYHFKDYKSITDTVGLPMLEACMSPTTAFSFIGYCCCEQKCNGKIVDYYLNGNIRAIGEFNNGIPNGNVIFYYSNGKIREINKYRKKGKLVWKKTFNENGDVLSYDKTKPIKI